VTDSGTSAVVRPWTWERLGLLDLGVPLGPPWTTSHAMVPTPIATARGTVEIYFASCDARGRGRPYVVEIDPERPHRALAPPRGPLLELGAPGCFDDNGVVPTSAVRAPDGRIHLYYVGFELCHGVRYRLFTGLAISTDDGASFRRHAEVPVLDRSTEERYFRCGAHVRHEHGAFRMWYVGGREWTELDGKQVPVYDIRYAESADGISWPAAGEPILAAREPHEHGLGRPWVVRRTGEERLLLSVRDRAVGGYRLGCAVRGADGALERRDDCVGLGLGAAGFDDAAMAYLAVIETAAGTIGFYNGNNFGEGGIGVARLREEESGA
jgi:hypothetical protein